MSQTDLICFSHLRWGFVYQRPNHLMSRFAKERRVHFIEEPIVDEGPVRLESTEITPNLRVHTPRILANTPPAESEAIQRRLVEELIATNNITSPILWFYTPMALPLAAGVHPSLVVYDCMDELSAFHGAPPELVEREHRLFARADLVFTGGKSLYESKRMQHPSVHCFPSSVDTAHFVRARQPAPEPPDQAHIRGNRVGFFGVIDERMDFSLLARLAESRPEYQFIMIGPVVKVSEDSLPKLPNLHFLGGKRYEELPNYIAGWQVAMMPFALNEATQFISPTKTLEYLAAGKPIVSTAIRDVVSPYGDRGVVRIADESSFANAIDEALSIERQSYLELCDRVLARTSWDRTWSDMLELINGSTRREARAVGAQKGDTSCSII